MGEMKINLLGIEIDNPIIPASGTFGFGYEFAEFYDINCLGTFSFFFTLRLHLTRCRRVDASATDNIIYVYDKLDGFISKNILT